MPPRRSVRSKGATYKKGDYIEVSIPDVFSRDLISAVRCVGSRLWLSIPSAWILIVVASVLARYNLLLALQLTSTSVLALGSYYLLVLHLHTTKPRSSKNLHSMTTRVASSPASSTKSHPKAQKQIQFGLLPPRTAAAEMKKFHRNNLGRSSVLLSKR